MTLQAPLSMAESQKAQQLATSFRFVEAACSLAHFSRAMFEVICRPMLSRLVC